MALQEVGAVAVLKGQRKFLDGMGKIGKSISGFAGGLARVGAVAAGAAAAGVVALGGVLAKLAII